MTRLILVAHASTDAAEQIRFPSDEPISERGTRELARATAPAVDRWVCAPEQRAVATARTFGSPVEIEPALRDLDYGSWAGLAMDELPEAELEVWLSDPAASPHGGESICDLITRVGLWLATLDPGYERVGAVTHPAVVRAAAVCALAAPASAFWRVEVRPLGAARLHGRPGRWTLRL